MSKTPTPASKIRLVQSDDQQPSVKLEAGKRYEVVVATIVDGNLDAVGPGTTPPARPPRLCGGNDTCVAIIETE